VEATTSLTQGVAHYPPYTSKSNPIEHRLFSQVERRWRGVMLDCAETALRTAEQTRTQTGLRVSARILDKAYEVGRKCSKRFREIKDPFIRHDRLLGDWELCRRCKWIRVTRRIPYFFE
jgi:hypothetical protein